MTREENKQGTSLDVLAPYLPYGIEVEFSLIKERRVLKAVELHENALLSEFGHLWPFDMCLPVLRPFSQLVEPLPDGTMPALEVAKLARGQFTNEKAIWGEPELLADRIRLEYRMPRTVASHLIMQDDWSALIIMGSGEQDYASNQSGIVDYLRRHHFAVGLEPHQFIEKAPASLQ